MRAAGKALPGVEIAIWDEEGKTLGPHEVGEIVTRSPANMTGYWGKPDATAKTIDTDGWLRTGDAGFLDEDGYVFIHDRVKDMIITGGENVYPAEVESVLYNHPKVVEVAIIGMPDERWGEAVTAVVSLKAGEELSLEELRTFGGENLARYKLPSRLETIDVLPRNPAGKVLKYKLREQYR
jgi:long-chain acyl-CoA synthetase